MIKKLINKIIDINSQITITSAIVSLSAKVARASGANIFLPKKIFFEIFKAPKKEERNIEKIFKLASQEVKGYDVYAKILYRKFKKHPEILEELLISFLKIAKANGRVSSSGLEIVKAIAKIFKIDETTFLRLCNSNAIYDFSNPYVVLGVNPSISPEDLKKRYTKLAKKYHPDNILACGLPAEMLDLSEHKMAEINKAYKEILNDRKK